MSDVIRGGVRIAIPSADLVVCQDQADHRGMHQFLECVTCRLVTCLSSAMESFCLLMAFWFEQLLVVLNHLPCYSFELCIIFDEQIQGNDVACDESALTGEPEEIKKDPKKRPHMLSGTSVMKGIP